MSIKIVSWNIGRSHQSWRELLRMNADPALLQEDASPPDDVFRLQEAAFRPVESIGPLDCGPLEAWGSHSWNSDWWHGGGSELYDRWSDGGSAVVPGRGRVVQAGRARRRGPSVMRLLSTASAGMGGSPHRLEVYTDILRTPRTYMPAFPASGVLNTMCMLSAARMVLALGMFVALILLYQTAVLDCPK